MYSIGVTCAEVYAKQKLLMEKMKRMEEERARSVVEEEKVGGSTSPSGKCKKKVHPGNLPVSGSEGKRGDARDNMA